ncbi:MAG: translocation/assembly module TamB domain-containing protein [Halioglobus sp.]
MKRWILLAAPLLAGVLLLALLPFTDWGVRYAVDLLDRLTPLEISYRGGNLLSEVEIEQLRLQLEDVDIRLHGLVLDIDPACLIVSTICLNTLRLENLDIEIISKADESVVLDSEPQLSELYAFPVKIQADEVAIAQILVHWDSGNWSNGAARARVTIDDSDVLIEDFYAVGGHLRLVSTTLDFDSRSARVDLPELDIPLQLKLVGGVLEAPRWTFDDYTHQHTRLALEADWINRTLSVSSVEMESEQWGRVRLAGELEFFDDWSIAARGTALLARPPVWQALHDSELVLDLAGTLGDLVVNASIEGDTAYELSGKIDTLDKYAPFDVALKLDWAGYRTLQSLSLVDASLADFQLLAPIEIAGRGTVIEQAFSLSGGAVGFGFEQLKLDISAVHGSGQVNVSSASLTDDSSSSRLEASGILQIEEQLSWDIKLQSEGMNIPQFNEQLSGRLKGFARTSGQWAGDDNWNVAVADVDLQGEMNNTPAQIHGFAGINSNWTLGPSEFEVIANSSELDVSVAENAPPSVRLEVADLSDWLPDSGGSLTLNATVTDSQRRFVFGGTASDIRLMDVWIPKLALEGYYQLADNQAFELSTTLDSLVYGDLALSSVQFALQGDESKQTATLSSLGDIAARMQFYGKSFSDKWSGQLLPTVLGTPVGQWQLLKPMDVNWDKNRVALVISDHCWQKIGRDTAGTACFSDIAIGETVAGKGSLQTELALSDQLVVAGASLEGSIDASVQLIWAPDTGLNGEAALAFSNGKLSRIIAEDDRATVSWERATASVSISSDEFSVQGEVVREGRRQVYLALQSPISGQGAIAGNIGFDQFNIQGVIKPIFPLISRHHGELDGNLALSGTLENPLLDGRLRLRDGAASMVGNPTKLEQLNLEINATGDKADVSGEFLLGGGVTQITGRVTLQPELSLDMEVSGRNQTILWPPSIEANVSETLRMEMTSQEGLVLTGSISIHDGLLEHEQLPEGSIDLSDDVVVVDYRGREIKERSVYPYSADVRVEIEDSFRVVGTGLEALVGGDVRLTKTTSVPLQVIGELNVINGKIDAFGQNLNIRRGNISFVGVPDNPDLNFRAEREIKGKNIQVGVRVQGNLEEITYELYSSTPMSESEMMSYLIRGRGLDRGAASDDAAVALSLGLGAVNQTGVVRGLNKIPGLSGVAFGTEGAANESSAMLGGYIGNRIYLAYGVGIYEPINVLTARFYILSRLWLEVVSRLENSADIYYSFDIE